MAPAVVVMGVSGSGKSTVGVELAGRLGVRFVDGDDLHPEANRAKMAAGVPLTDDDRWPWLDGVRDVLAAGLSGDGGVVVACSALRRAYRDRLRAAGAGVRFAYLRVDRADVLARVSGRSGHFFPPALVASQFETLEEPDPTVEPDVLVPPPGGSSAQVDYLVAALRAERFQGG